MQSNLRVGGRAPRRTDDWYAAGQLANGIYGGSFSSRLTQNIREDKGYTYSPYSGIRHLRGDSRVVTSAEVATEVTAPAMVEVLYELGRIAALPPKPDELEATVQYLTGTLALGTATQTGLADTLADLLSDGKSVDWLQEYPARLAATTPEEVMEAGARMFAPASMVSVVVGDADVVEPGLAMLTEVARGEARVVSRLVPSRLASSHLRTSDSAPGTSTSESAVLGHPCVAQQVDEAELAGCWGDRWGRLPRGVEVQVGVRVSLEQPDEHLGDDAATHRTETFGVVRRQLGLLEDVVPERGLAAPARVVASPRAALESTGARIACATCCPDGSPRACPA